MSTAVEIPTSNPTGSRNTAETAASTIWLYRYTNFCYGDERGGGILTPNSTGVLAEHISESADATISAIDIQISCMVMAVKYYNLQRPQELSHGQTQQRLYFRDRYVRQFVLLAWIPIVARRKN